MTAALDAVQREVMRRGYAGAQCVLHERHTPRILVGVRWHLFPEFLQQILWGEIRETDSVVMCPCGESAVLMALVDLLIGHGFTAAYTADERRFALLAFDKWRTAVAATQV